MGMNPEQPCTEEAPNRDAFRHVLSPDETYGETVVSGGMTYHRVYVSLVCNACGIRFTHVLDSDKVNHG